MPRQMPVYSENERRYRVQPSALPSRQLRHHSRHNPFPGIDLQFRLPSHPRPAVIGDFDNLIQLKVGSKSEGSLVLVPKLRIHFLPSWTCEGARPTLCIAARTEINSVMINSRSLSTSSGVSTVGLPPGCLPFDLAGLVRDATPDSSPRGGSSAVGLTVFLARLVLIRSLLYASAQRDAMTSSPPHSDLDKTRRE
jgi:hypothetical protein